MKRILLALLLCPLLAFASKVQLLDKVVAVVNDGVITERELDDEMAQVKKQISAKNTPLPAPAALKKQVLQHLINVKLELGIAKQNNITVDNIELNDAISKIAKDNHLGLDELKSLVSQQGMSWESYRKNIQKEMLLARLQQGAVSKDIQISDEQIDNYMKSASTEMNQGDVTYHVQNIVIPLSEEPTNHDIAKATQKAQELLAKIHKGADFSQLALESSSGEFALEGGDLGDRHLAEMPTPYAKKVTSMKVGETTGPIRTGNGLHLIKLTAVSGGDGHHELVKTHVRHILIKSDNTMTEDEAKAQALHIYQEIKSGKPFDMMAKQYSLDATSAVNGGDLGWVTPGELVPPFEAAMDKLQPNQVSEPVKSAFGWHIIEVLARKKEDNTAEFKRQQVRLFLQQRKFSEAVETWQQRLRTDAYVKILDKQLA